MVDKSKLAIATSQIQNPIPFLIELLFNLLSQMITKSTIKLTFHPVRSNSQGNIKNKYLFNPLLLLTTIVFFLLFTFECMSLDLYL